MRTYTLEDARIQEEKHIADRRPAFHLSARKGWMNDPNGFSYYKGTYHMFYQYYPYETQWGPMHWGHAVSQDLLHWEYLPAALAPDQDYDKVGCFSGSAVELPDGRQLLMYTGVHSEYAEDGSHKDIQTQCLAVGDGMDYVKYDQNPILTKDSLPEGLSPYDFRDPKLWECADGSYRCVIGACTKDKDGRILLFDSADGFRWQYKRTLAVNAGRCGRMWECPDYFPLQGRQVLLVSPQEMLPKGVEVPAGNNTLCIIGDGDEQGDQFAEVSSQIIDYGIDFYAPQTVLAPDGRRIMIGWMQNWDTPQYRKDHQKWFGQMSIPRELSIAGDRLIQQPIRELEQLRGECVQYSCLLTDETCRLEGISGRQIDLELELEPESNPESKPENEKQGYRQLEIRIAEMDDLYTVLRVLPEEGLIQVDRTYAGARQAAVHQRSCPVRMDDGKVELRLILDTYSVEVFVNGGEQVLTTTIYTPEEAEGISFRADGAVRMKVTKYDLQV